MLCMHDQGCVATHPVTRRRAPLLADKPVHLPGPVGCAQQVDCRSLKILVQAYAARLQGRGFTFFEMKVGCVSSVAASPLTMSLKDSREARACAHNPHHLSGQMQARHRFLLVFSLSQSVE